MINPQLLEYVRAQRTAGLSKEAIVQALAQGGWTPQDVTEAFMAIDGVQTPPPPPPPAAPGPVTPRVVQPPVQPSAPPFQPIGTQFGTPPPTPRPVMAASELSTARVAAKEGHGFLYALLGILALLVVGLGVFVYLQPTFIMDMLGLGSGARIEEPLTPPENAPIQIVPIVPTPDASSTASTTIGTTTSQ